MYDNKKHACKSSPNEKSRSEQLHLVSYVGKKCVQQNEASPLQLVIYVVRFIEKNTPKYDTVDIHAEFDLLLFGEEAYHFGRVDSFEDRLFS